MKRLLIVAMVAAAYPQDMNTPAPPAPERVVLNDAPLGAIVFQHRLHEGRAGGECGTCHHPSRPEMPARREFQACRDCHTRPPQSGMKTSRQAAFHNVSAQSGTCVDCHRKQLATGRKPPVKCLDCHRKEDRAARGDSPLHPAGL
jgi:hypothetical protein